jgi:hypothetical protein
VYVNWVHNHGLDNFKDWHCEAGSQRIFVDINGNIFNGECRNEKLGTLGKEWNLLNEGQLRCKRDRCTGCTDDLLALKFKKN